MLKFLSKVVVEYCPLDPRKAAAVELLAQCNGRKAKDSNPACSVELRRLPSPPAAEELKPPQIPPPRVLVTYLNGAEEAFVAADGATAQGIREQILARGRLIETEQMFRDGGEKWPVVIPEEELAMSYPGIKVCFVYEVFLPVLKGWSFSLEDEAVPLLPNVPGLNYEDFHEEGVLHLSLDHVHHGEEICIQLPLDVQECPTLSAEGE